MANKILNSETFYIYINETDYLTICCQTIDTRYGFKHTAWCAQNDMETKICYYNRTWESYRYQSVLAKLFSKMGKEYETIFRLWDMGKVQNETLKCNEFIAKFSAEYKKLNDKQKDRLKGVELRTKDDAEALLGMIQAFNLIAE